MATNKPRRPDQSEILANIFGSVILIGIIIFTGQYRHPEFWLAVATFVGIVYLISIMPDRLKVVRWALILGGFLTVGAFETYFETWPDVSAAAIIYLLALFWLPLIRALRLPAAVSPEEQNG